MADQQNPILDPSIQALVNQANQQPQPQEDPDYAQALGLNGYLNIRDNLTPQLPGAPAPAPAGAPPLGQTLKSKPVTPQMRAEARTDNYQDAMRNSVKEQNLGLDQLQLYIQSIQDKPRDVNWTPLAAYVDTLGNNSHLADAAKSMAPMTSEERDKMIFGLQNQLQQGRAQLSKEKLEALHQQFQTQHQNAMESIGMRMAGAAEKRADNIGVGAGIRQDNQTATAVDKVVNDKQLFLHSQRIQGADRIMNQLDNAKAGKIVDTDQLLNDLNSEYVNLLRGSQNTALGHLERTEYTSASAKLARMYQNISADPTSINSPKILEQLRNSVQELKGNYNKVYDTRAQSLQRSYVHNPEATKQMADKIAEMRSQYGTNGNAVLEESASLPKIGEIQNSPTLGKIKYIGGDPGSPQAWAQVK